MTTPEPPAVWWSPSLAVDGRMGLHVDWPTRPEVHEVAAGGDLPADAVRLVPEPAPHGRLSYEDPRKDRDHMAEYRSFWQDLVETDGVLDVDKVARELSDFSFMMDQVPIVYDEITGGRMSKPMYFARDVIAEANEWVQEIVDADVAEARQFWEDETGGAGVAALLARCDDAEQVRRIWAGNNLEKQEAWVPRASIRTAVIREVLGSPATPPAAPRAPTADWSGSWAELTGYVQQAADDDIQLDPTRLGLYLVELKRRALAPVAKWMADLQASAGPTGEPSA